MKTLFDFPFPADWTADDLVDAVPRPLSALFDFDLAAAGPAASPRAPAATGLSRRYPIHSALPLLFQIR